MSTDETTGGQVAAAQDGQEVTGTRGRAGLAPMTKVEVVVRGEDVPAVEALFRAAGVTGFTGVTGVSGLGHDGYHQGRLLFNDQAVLSLLLTVVPDDRAEGLLTGLRTLFEDRSGVMFVSDVYVSRPDYFR
jgi:nitrogen regulatory protein PII